jgi:hypothetical protein
MRTLTMVLALFALSFAVGCKQEKSTVQTETGKKLTLVAPGNVKIERGNTAKVTVKIKRDKLEGPVGVNFDKLPNGVSLVNADQKITSDEAEYTLKASDTADLVDNHVAQVTAKGPEGVAVTESFKVTVVEKK